MKLKVTMTKDGNYMIKYKIPFLPFYLPAEKVYSYGGAWSYKTYKTQEEAEYMAKQMILFHRRAEKLEKEVKKKRKEFVEPIFCSECKDTGGEDEDLDKVKRANG